MNTVSSIMNKEIIFNIDGYEPFGDFLKGYSIIEENDDI